MKTPFSLLLKSFALSHSLRFCMSMLGFLGLLLIHPASFAQTAPQVEVTTNVGTFVLELYPEAAPKTVKNFLHYVNSGFYNGTIFHRVIDNFMIQGGGMDKNLKNKKTAPPIPLEAQSAFDHGFKNSIGTIAMAREMAPNTANSEFFINVADNDFLDPTTLPEGDPVQFMRRGTLRTMPRAEALSVAAGYAVFGKVIAGMDVINRIKIVPTYARGQDLNIPVEPIIIVTATVLKNPITPQTIEQQLQPAAPLAPANEPAAEPAMPAN